MCNEYDKNKTERDIDHYSINTHRNHRTRSVENQALSLHARIQLKSLQETTYSFKINLVHPFQADLQGRHLKT